MEGLDQFTRHFEQSLEGAKANSLTPDALFDSISGWDSLAVLVVIAMIDTEYHVTIAADDFIKCKTVRELFEVVSTKTVQ